MSSLFNNQFLQVSIPSVLIICRSLLLSKTNRLVIKTIKTLNKEVSRKKKKKKISVSLKLFGERERKEGLLAKLLLMFAQLVSLVT